VFYLDALPRNANGKAMKADLRERAAQDIEAAAENSEVR